jgi:hypothetical protein
MSKQDCMFRGSVFRAQEAGILDPCLKPKITDRWNEEQRLLLMKGISQKAMNELSMVEKENRVMDQALRRRTEVRRTCIPGCVPGGQIAMTAHKLSQSVNGRLLPWEEKIIEQNAIREQELANAKARYCGGNAHNILGQSYANESYGCGTQTRSESCNYISQQSKRSVSASRARLEDTNRPYEYERSTRVTTIRDDRPDIGNRSMNLSTDMYRNDRERYEMEYEERSTKKYPYKPYRATTSHSSNITETIFGDLDKARGYKCICGHHCSAAQCLYPKREVTVEETRRPRQSRIHREKSATTQCFEEGSFGPARKQSRETEQRYADTREEKVQSRIADRYRELEESRERVRSRSRPAEVEEPPRFERAVRKSIQRSQRGESFDGREYSVNEKTEDRPQRRSILKQSSHEVVRQRDESTKRIRKEVDDDEYGLVAGSKRYLTQDNVIRQPSFSRERQKSVTRERENSRSRQEVGFEEETVRQKRASRKSTKPFEDENSTRRIEGRGTDFQPRNEDTRTGISRERAQRDSHASRSQQLGEVHKVQEECEMLERQLADKLSQLENIKKNPLQKAATDMKDKISMEKNLKEFGPRAAAQPPKCTPSQVQPSADRTPLRVRHNTSGNIPAYLDDVHASKAAPRLPKDYVNRKMTELNDMEEELELQKLIDEKNKVKAKVMKTKAFQPYLDNRLTNCMKLTAQIKHLD